MARLNDPQVSTDSLETLRRKLLRQNRDLAKANNVRALRIRELENECACMLSENLQLRSRILDLEKQVEDNEARRIADHALDIKRQLESQLAEFGTLLAGLGLEPPMKRHSPRIRKSIKQRMSFSYNRPSPSQRRLRDVAHEIEELGHISEHKTYPRMTLDSDQIQALRFEADVVESPELGPPPMSQFIDDEPAKVDSPPARSPLKEIALSPKRKLEPPVMLPSPQPQKFLEKLPSPEKKPMPLKKEAEEPQVTVPEVLRPQQPRLSDAPTAQSNKTGIKRKFAGQGELQPRPSNENQPTLANTQKTVIREKTGGKVLKDITKKETREKPLGTNPRRALAAKSTNDDISSPKKNPRSTITDEVQAAKADLLRSRAANERTRSRPKSTVATEVVTVPTPKLATPIILAELSEPQPLSLDSPEPAAIDDVPREGTPPPGDISSSGEAARPSRRNRTAVSYAEPSLRDKMRRPGKEMTDAVDGSRRASQSGDMSIKRESDLVKSLGRIPLAPVDSFPPADAELDFIPASPCASKSVLEDASAPTVAPRRGRQSMVQKRSETNEVDEAEVEANKDESLDSVSTNDDVYEIPSPSSQNTRRRGGRQRSSRRFSAAVESEDNSLEQKQLSSRRRSMMM